MLYQLLTGHGSSVEGTNGYGSPRKASSTNVMSSKPTSKSGSGDELSALKPSPMFNAAELWEQQWTARHLRFCLKQVLESVSPTNRHAFELYVISGWSVKHVTEAMKISANQVYAAKSRVTRLLKTKVRMLLEENVLLEQRR